MRAREKFGAVISFKFNAFIMMIVMMKTRFWRNRKVKWKNVRGNRKKKLD